LNGKVSLELEVETLWQSLSAALDMASGQPCSLTSQKRYRQDGVTPMAEQHTITMGESWIDVTIMRMKKAAYSNKEIANKLRQQSDGAVDYDPKSIATRAARISKKFSAHVEQRIDDNLSDWHEGEDEALLEAEAKTHFEMHKQIEKIKSKRWEYVARNLDLALKKGVAYSAESCKKRFISLQNDTATIPIELADNPEQRLIDRQQRNVELLQHLLDAEAADQNAKNQKKLEKDERELSNKRRNEERTKKAVEKSRVAAEKAAERQAKAQAEYEQKEKLRVETNERIAELQKNIATGISTRPDQLTPAQKRKRDPEVSTRASYSKQSAKHPRSRMTVVELSALCVARKIRKSGSKIQLQQRLEKEANSANVKELRKRLASYGAQTSGSKAELIERLAQADEANSQWTAANNSNNSPRGGKRLRKLLTSKSVIEKSAGHEDVDSPASGSLNTTPVTTCKPKVLKEKANTSQSELSPEEEIPQNQIPSCRPNLRTQRLKINVQARTDTPLTPSTTTGGNAD